MPVDHEGMLSESDLSWNKGDSSTIKEQKIEATLNIMGEHHEVAVEPQIAEMEVRTVFTEKAWEIDIQLEKESTVAENQHENALEESGELEFSGEEQFNDSDYELNDDQQDEVYEEFMDEGMIDFETNVKIEVKSQN